MRFKIIVASVFALLGFSVSCGSGSGGEQSSATIPSDLRLDAVYARMERALDGGSDRVLHASIVIEDVTSSFPTPEGFDKIDPEDYAQQEWIDAAHGVARMEARVRLRGEDEDRVTRSIVRGDGSFRVDSDGTSHDFDSLTCRGSTSVLLARLMQCGNPIEKSTTSVEPGEYGGAAAIVVITTGTLSDEDTTTPFTMRLYVDPSSYLH